MGVATNSGFLSPLRKPPLSSTDDREENVEQGSELSSSLLLEHSISYTPSEPRAYTWTSL